MFAELWQYRGLIWAFSKRDLKIRYFQTVLGPLWVVFTPLITVGVMTFVFGLMVKIPSDNLPYLIFYLVAIVPWYSFISVFNQTVSTLEAHAGLINKIYFPRLVIPCSYAINGSIDFLVGFTIACGFAVYFDVFSFWFIVAMPLLLLTQMAWALGLGLMLAPYNARLRDVKHIIPLFIQLYYFATPVLYPVSLAPHWAKWLYQVNPLATIISVYRSCLNGSPIAFEPLIATMVFAFCLFLIGAFTFMRKERDMVDVL